MFIEESDAAPPPPPNDGLRHPLGPLPPAVKWEVHTGKDASGCKVWTEFPIEVSKSLEKLHLDQQSGADANIDYTWTNPKSKTLFWVAYSKGLRLEASVSNGFVLEGTRGLPA
jgi:hypothetical protein